MKLKRGPDHEQLFNLASPQAGYFTAEQAMAAGFSRQLLPHHAIQGTFIHVHRGLYRLARFPSSPHEEIVAAWLGFGPKKAVVSHESALQLFGLADRRPDHGPSDSAAVPAVPQGSAGVTAHTVLRPPCRDGVVIREGVRVTTPARAVADAAAYGTAPEQVDRAAREALRRGLATRNELLAAARHHGGRPEHLVRQAIAEGGAG